MLGYRSPLHSLGMDLIKHFKNLLPLKLDSITLNVFLCKEANFDYFQDISHLVLVPKNSFEIH